MSPRARMTSRDESLAHQIRLTHSQQRPATHLAVSCNCRKFRYGYTPFAEVHCAEDPWPAYNDPSNHDNSKETFVPRAKHVANMKVVWIP